MGTWWLVVVYCLVSEPWLLLALMVKLELDAAVAVPEITPVLASSDRPSGSEPALTVNEIAPEPAAATFPTYAFPTTGSDSDDVEITAATCTVIEYALDTVPAAFVADTVNEAAPPAVGVPEISPVA